jgi:c-di-GMP-binding flagellar brake protein YcgR
MAEKTISSWGQLVTLRPGDYPDSVATEERRTWIRYVCDLVTICQPTTKAQTEPFLARVRNISQGGINLVVDQCFESGSILSVELPDSDGKPTCTLLMCVIHCTPQAGGDWALGCSFVRELSDDDLEPYGAKRVPGAGQDQRVWRRFTCDLKATYRIVRVTERTPAPAKVVDISARGVGLQIDRAIQPGTVLSVDLQSTDGVSKLRIFACVVRVKEVNSREWTLGCNFIREINDRELNGLISGLQI